MRKKISETEKFMNGGKIVPMDDLLKLDPSLENRAFLYSGNGKVQATFIFKSDAPGSFDGECRMMPGNDTILCPQALITDPYVAQFRKLLKDADYVEPFGDDGKEKLRVPLDVINAKAARALAKGKIDSGYASIWLFKDHDDKSKRVPFGKLRMENSVNARLKSGQMLTDEAMDAIAKAIAAKKKKNP